MSRAQMHSPRCVGDKRGGHEGDDGTSDGVSVGCAL